MSTYKRSEEIDAIYMNLIISTETICKSPFHDYRQQ